MIYRGVIVLKLGTKRLKVYSTSHKLFPDMVFVSDCGFWNSSTSLRFVNDVSSTEVIVPTAQNLQASRCLVDHAGSSYLACDGAWKPIGTSASTSSTQFKLTFVSATASEWKHKLHVSIESWFVVKLSQYYWPATFPNEK